MTATVPRLCLQAECGNASVTGIPDSGDNSSEEVVATGEGADRSPTLVLEREASHYSDSHVATAASLSYKSELAIHQRSNIGHRPFLCEDCNKDFKQASDLHVHQRIHTGKKPFVCSNGCHMFSHEASLVTNRSNHTQEQLHICKYCVLCFSHKGNLNVHYQIHTNTKPYCCEICGQFFQQLGTFKNHLKMHLRAMSPVQEPRLC
ncbi:zinc finger and SCAN domain-containing protein 5B-like [Ochotona princeps]|uniref:zinc finger and SCAN domain-containing protein 5B-like n=1 Tax=Ochotona princeps TaxID=9978 RepID=UPI002715603A|nr:zinc finger and SCAN domain-containing protein 5B-like [Ochotona princeps]